MRDKDQKELKSHCLYCGETIEPGPRDLAEMAAHIWACRKHPLERVMMVVDRFHDDAGNYEDPEHIMRDLRAELHRVRDAFLANPDKKHTP